VNFYFAPGYGYYSVPRQYYGRSYQIGDYLPNVFWRYRVHDWAWYGLPAPPPGCAWVYVDNSIFLVDLFDGYIIDTAYQVWRW
jgi:Ni/Co efflux regulator RcnB